MTAKYGKVLLRNGIENALWVFVLGFFFLVRKTAKGIFCIQGLITTTKEKFFILK